MIEILILGQTAILTLMLLWRSPGVVARDLVASLGPFYISVILMSVAGVAGRSLWAVARGSFQNYWLAIRTRDWVMLSVRLCILQMAMMTFYSLLKLFIPLFNPRSFDRELWELDRLLFFGFSPNSFLLELFKSPALLRFIDFVYSRIFFGVVLLASPFIISRTDSSHRVAFFIGNSVLWSIAVLIYILIPSIGPIYRFPEVFAGTDAFFPHSRNFQILLMKNYIAFVRVLEGLAPAHLSLSFGVAAFPSMHVGFESFVAMWLSRESRRVGALVWLLTGITIIGSVATGWHYLVDAIAGLLLAWLCFLLARGLERRYQTRISGAGAGD
ncbi:MAG TPA: phosphatase PAP2 family protein [Thermoanaerobaculia bacterium]|nr:phosphatase PAP2 family protein [Thermoanaerobaculia bacterium]